MRFTRHAGVSLVPQTEYRTDYQNGTAVLYPQVPPLSPTLSLLSLLSETALLLPLPLARNLNPQPLALSRTRSMHG